MTDDANLTDVERDEVRNLSYAGGFSQEKADWYIATVERIVAVHVAAERECIAQAIEALPTYDRWGSVPPGSVRQDAARIARVGGAS